MMLLFLSLLWLLLLLLFLFLFFEGLQHLQQFQGLFRTQHLGGTLWFGKPSRPGSGEKKPAELTQEKWLFEVGEIIDG